MQIVTMACGFLTAEQFSPVMQLSETAGQDLSWCYDHSFVLIHDYNINWTLFLISRCNTCGEYIYKGKKFNSRKETVENENYLGLHIFRFYIKCPRCIAEIAFKVSETRVNTQVIIKLHSSVKVLSIAFICLHCHCDCGYASVILITKFTVSGSHTAG